MISQDKMKSYIKNKSQELEEVWNKLGSVVRSDVSWNTIFGEDVDNKQFS